MKNNRLLNGVIEYPKTSQDEKFERNKTTKDLYPSKKIFVGLSESNIVFSCVCDTLQQAKAKLDFQIPANFMVELKEITDKKLLHPTEYTYHLVK